MNIKPFLLRSDRIPAVKSGRMTVYRMPVKKRGVEIIGRPSRGDREESGFWFDVVDKRGRTPYATVVDIKPPYQPGDILYVKETYDELPVRPDGTPSGDHKVLYYKADGDLRPRAWRLSWRPALQMPLNVARIFVRVTDVRVERLRDIFLDPPGPQNQIVREGYDYGCDFIAGWEGTVKPSERHLYGYDANPWVWVLELERCNRPQEM